MKKSFLFLFIILIVSCIGANGQTKDGAKTGPKADLVAELGDSLGNTSSLFYWQGRLWTLNDHFSVIFYSIDSVTGNVDTALDTGLPIVDLEEVVQDEEYFYLGDFGNNQRVPRSELNIYRMSKSGLLSGNFAVDTTRFLFYGYEADSVVEDSYLPTTDFDCEAMVAMGDSLYLFSKQWTGMRTVCYALPKTPGTYTADSCGSYDVEGLVTGAWIHSDSSLLVLDGYNILCQPFVCLFYDYEGHDFFGGESRKVVLANGFGTQTEAIVSRDGLHFFLTNEFFNRMGICRPPQLLRLDLSDYLGDYLRPDTDRYEGMDSVVRSVPEVYPNPTDGGLTVVVPQEAERWPGASVVLYAISGQEVLRRPVSVGRMRLPLGDVPAGEYLLRVVWAGGTTAAVPVVKR